MSARPGQTLSHYRLIEKIGEGGMGVVWRALDTRLDREVAIKVLPEEFAADAERLARFEREAKAVAVLNHPNIVTLHSVEEAEGVHFFTMELVEGPPLSKLIPGGGLALDRLLDIAVPLADALSAAHEHGITHRDLKPANIVVGKDGRPRILDFGLAKLRREEVAAADSVLATRSDDLTRDGLLLGTAPYMSPEQVEGKPVDHRSDVFSLGVVLYEMATGSRPFTGESWGALASSILRDTPPPVTELNPGLPAELARIVRHCLRKDPEHRYQTAKGLRNELDELRRDVVSETTVAAPAAGPAPSRGVARHARWFVPVAVVIALGSILFYREIGPPQEPAPTRSKVVVLPFENLGPPEDEYFAAGITEEITSRLAVVRDLGVISRTSAFQYDTTGKTMAQIGEDLGVDYVLEGTVRWAREDPDAARVRVVPQLIRVADDTHLWAERYERVMEDMFEVQSDIAENVVAQLGIALSGPEREAVGACPTDNLEAYQAYLRGLTYSDLMDQESSALAVEMFRTAVDLDPGFALAHAALGRTHAWIHHAGWDRTPERVARAEQTLERARELAPEAPEVHRAQGFFFYYCHRDYHRALSEFTAALRDRPNDTETLAAVASVYQRQGRFSEAIERLEEVLEIDPLNPTVARGLGVSYMLLREYRKADALFDRVISFAPDYWYAYSSKAMNYRMWDGEPERARSALAAAPREPASTGSVIWYWQLVFERNWRAALERLESLPLEVTAEQDWYLPKSLLECFCYIGMGDSGRARASCDEARVILEEAARRDPDDHRIHSALGLAYARLGRKEEAIREGELAVTIYPVSKDAVGGMKFVHWLAKIYAWTGEADAALDRIEYLLSIPSWLSVGTLRLDPDWDPIRDHPRFRRLVEDDDSSRDSSP